MSPLLLPLEGELIAGSGNPRWRQPWDLANAHSFRAVA
jgi:hypothetical protein